MQLQAYFIHDPSYSLTASYSSFLSLIIDRSKSDILKEKVFFRNFCLLWTRGQSGYPQVTGRGRVDALGVGFESGRPDVLPVRRLSHILRSQEKLFLSLEF